MEDKITTLEEAEAMAEEMYQPPFQIALDFEEQVCYAMETIRMWDNLNFLQKITRISAKPSNMDYALVKDWRENQRNKLSDAIKNK